jgi:hypothetical protein
MYLAAPAFLFSQSPGTAPDPAAGAPAPAANSPLSHERILGVIPNFQTVNDPNVPYKPLRAHDKWMLALKESADPYSFGSAAAGALLSQWHDSAPKYGHGAGPYFERFGAAQADMTSQNLFSDAILASLFHEDPRYFRMGPQRKIVIRVIYALSRVAIIRRDSGKEGLSYSGIGGTVLGIALSNAYYPASSVNGGEMESRLATSFSASALGNLLPEFWPDVKAKLARLKH